MMGRTRCCYCTTSILFFFFCAIGTTTTAFISPVVIKSNNKSNNKKNTVVLNNDNRPKVSAPTDFVAPDPKPLAINENANVLDLVTSSIALALRLGTGAFVLGWGIDTLFAPDDDENYALSLGPFRLRDSSSVLNDAPRPTKPLILYEYDASPYCKRVREMINLLDLTVEYRPCPGARQGAFSQELGDRTGGKRTVPYLIDPNTEMEMFESTQQIEYLLKTYGPRDTESYDRKALWPITFEAFSILTSTLVAIVRNMPGSTRQINARDDNEQMLPLELYGYECSPFVRPVREKLGSLCLPHLMISSSRGSSNRNKLLAKVNTNQNNNKKKKIAFQVPYLIDPNTGIEMFEGAEIVNYLERVYTTE